jgi:rod shape-determining protein MreB
MRKIAIDLGTANSLVATLKDGLISNEPSVVAISVGENRVLAVGKEARKMIGRTPETIRVYRPLKNGVIADYRVTQAMLKHFISKASRRLSFLKPEVIVSVPADITSAERRAVIEGALSAGARQAFIAKEPILAAIGAGIPIESCSGHMIVDIGGGTSEVAVISLGGIVTCDSVRVGGDAIDRAIINYIKTQYNLAIGEQTAEETKRRIGTAIPERKEKILEIRGRDLLSGLPKDIKVSSNEIQKGIAPILEDIVRSIKSVLRRTPPELSADIMNKGIILAGGGSLLRNIDQLISREVKVPCFLADDPLLSVIRGLTVILENLDLYKKSVMEKR